MLQELHSAAANAPHCVRPLDSFIADGRVSIVMDIAATDLDSVLESLSACLAARGRALLFYGRGLEVERVAAAAVPLRLISRLAALPLPRLSWEVIQFVMGELLAALMETHAAGFMHRDVKPGNVLLFDNRRCGGATPADRAADDGTAAVSVRLCDFGMAHRLPQFRQVCADVEESAAAVVVAAERVFEHAHSIPHSGQSDVAAHASVAAADPAAAAEAEADTAFERQQRELDVTRWDGGSHPQVITLSYRPPELLFGSRRHGAAVDSWSAGIVLLELLRLRRALSAVERERAPLAVSPVVADALAPVLSRSGGNTPALPSFPLRHHAQSVSSFGGDYRMFPALSEIDCICRMSALLGPPSEAVWPGVEALPGYMDLGEDTQQQSATMKPEQQQIDPSHQQQSAATTSEQQQFISLHQQQVTFGWGQQNKSAASMSPESLKSPVSGAAAAAVSSPLVLGCSTGVPSSIVAATPSGASASTGTPTSTACKKRGRETTIISPTAAERSSSSVSADARQCGTVEGSSDSARHLCDLDTRCELLARTNSGASSPPASSFVGHSAFATSSASTAASAVAPSPPCSSRSHPRHAFWQLSARREVSRFVLSGSSAASTAPACSGDITSAPDTESAARESAAIDVALRLLTYCPRCRLSPAEALQMPFLAQRGAARNSYCSATTSDFSARAGGGTVADGDMRVLLDHVTAYREAWDFSFSSSTTRTASDHSLESDAYRGRLGTPLSPSRTTMTANAVNDVGASPSSSESRLSPSPAAAPLQLGREVPVPTRLTGFKLGGPGTGIGMGPLVFEEG